MPNTDKLTIDILAQYLPYGLTFRAKANKDSPVQTYRMDAIRVHDTFKVWAYDIGKFVKGGFKMDEINNLGACSGRGFRLSEIKPILHHMNDYVGSECEAQVNKRIYGYNPTNHDLNTTIQSRFGEVHIKLQHRFDVFGLIDKGLAVDIKTIK